MPVLLQHGRSVPLQVNATPCKSCGSSNLQKFGAEMAIHFSGLKNIDKPHVYVCSEIVVCMTCGAAQLAIQAAELRQLQEGKAASAG